MSSALPVIEIDGREFSTLEEFFEHFGQRALTAPWGTNLDAFNDVLRGGFGTPEGGFVIRWRHHAISRKRLGHEETARQLQRMLTKCHSDNREHLMQELQQAQSCLGPTVFDWLIEIIRDHGPDGAESEDNVHLELD